MVVVEMLCFLSGRVYAWRGYAANIPHVSLQRPTSGCRWKCGVIRVINLQCGGGVGRGAKVRSVLFLMQVVFVCLQKMDEKGKNMLKRQRQRIKTNVNVTRGAVL